MFFGIYNKNLFNVLYNNPFEALMIDSIKIELGQKIPSNIKSIIDIIIYNFGDLSATQLNNILFYGCSPLDEIYSNPEVLYSSILKKTKVSRELIKKWYELEILMKN